jgi:hypothetical protein
MAPLPDSNMAAARKATCHAACHAACNDLQARAQQRRGRQPTKRSTRNRPTYTSVRSGATNATAHAQPQHQQQRHGRSSARTAAGISSGAAAHRRMHSRRHQQRRIARRTMRHCSALRPRPGFRPASRCCASTRGSTLHSGRVEHLDSTLLKLVNALLILFQYSWKVMSDPATDCEGAGGTQGKCSDQCQRRAVRCRPQWAQGEGEGIPAVMAPSLSSTYSD